MKKLLYAFMFFVPFVTYSMEEFQKSGKDQLRGRDQVLFNAIWNDNQAVVSAALKNGASVEVVWWNALDESSNPERYDYIDGLKPLHMAAFKKNLVIMQTLFNNGVSVDQRATRNRTPLHAAIYGIRDVDFTPRIPYTHPDIYNVNIEAVRLLVSNGANIQAQNGDGTTLFHLLAQRAQYGKLKINGMLWEKDLPRLVIKGIIDSDPQLNAELIFSDLDQGKQARAELVKRLQTALQIKDEKGKTPHNIYQNKIFDSQAIWQWEQMVEEAWKSQFRAGEKDWNMYCWIENTGE